MPINSFLLSGNSTVGRYCPFYAENEFAILNKEPFEGVVDKVGNCRITGLYITLLRDVSYVATGKISSSSIHLQVKGERNVFKLLGNTCPKSEETMI